MPEYGIGEVATTTARNRRKKLVDNITNSNPILKALDEDGGIQMEDGGRTLVEEVLYAETGNYIRYDGYQFLNMSQIPTMTAFEVDWKQAAVTVSWSGREKRMNAGSERIIKLVSGRMKAAEATAQNNMHSDILSDGTSDGGKQIGGLALWISKTPTTGTIGGIDRSIAANAWARNFKFDTINDTTGGAPGGNATNAGNIKDYYTYCILNTERGADRTNLILAGTAHYRALMSAMQSIQIIQSSDTARAGFRNIVFEGVEVVHGGGVSFGGESLLTSDRSYGLNTKYLHLRIHKDANWDPLPEVQSINQDAECIILPWMGNMTSSAPKLQWVMFDS